MPYKLNPITQKLDYYSTANVVVTDPPATMCRVTNIYVDPNLNKTIIKYETVAGGGTGSITSDPPTGKYKVTNVYVNPSTGRLIVKYDNTPAS